jgi:hypothetical protein
VGRGGFVGERRRLWPRNRTVASVMDQFYGRAWTTPMRLPRPAMPPTKFVGVHCVAKHGRTDGRTIACRFGEARGFDRDRSPDQA